MELLSQNLSTNKSNSVCVLADGIDFHYERHSLAMVYSLNTMQMVALCNVKRWKGFKNKISNLPTVSYPLHCPLKISPFLDHCFPVTKTTHEVNAVCLNDLDEQPTVM